MSLRPRPNIEKLQPCTHGGPDYCELESLGLCENALLDFSVNCNPFGSPDGVRRTFANLTIHRYPDPQCTELRHCLAQRLEVTPDNILIGNGSVELIRLAALAYFGLGDRVLIFEPTFGEYEVACRIAGAEPVICRLRDEAGFKLKADEAIDLIRELQPKGVFLCNPNNPTGQYLEEEDFRRILTACRDGLLILDEAYITFVDNAWSSLRMIREGNLLVLRSLTKDYALAGLRLGYTVANDDIIDALRRVCPPWNVNAIAQQAGILAFQDEDYLAHCCREMQRAKNFLVEELANTGFNPLPSRANFFLIKVGDAKKFRLALLKQSILVRDCTSFGLPEYVRIAVRALPDCQRLITAIKALEWEIDV